MNQTLEQYIRMYCAYHQDDWAELLPLGEFALNNAPNASTSVSPFFMNKGYHPLLTFSDTTVVGPDVDKAQDYAYELQSVHEYLRKQLTIATECYKEIADKKRLPDPPLEVGDQVFVSTEFIATTQRTEKFSATHFGPYEVIEKTSGSSYRIWLPKALSHIHPIFHISTLEPHFPNPFPAREQPPPGPVEIINGDEHFELAAIFDSKIDKCYRRCPLRYYVEWFGWSHTSDQYQWVPAFNLDVPELLAAFYARYLEKPGPEWEHI
jgi:hypothetical protein